MPDGFARYGQPPDTGLDDWASKLTYEWLASNGALITSINDVSGEHARDLDHSWHERGTDIDMFHVYPVANAGITATDYYFTLRRRMLAALNGNADARSDIVGWVSTSRARLEGKTLETGLGAWSKADDSKIKYNNTHNNHIHIALGTRP